MKIKEGKEKKEETEMRNHEMVKKDYEIILHYKYKEKSGEREKNFLYRRSRIKTFHRPDRIFHFFFRAVKIECKYIRLKNSHVPDEVKKSKDNEMMNLSLT